MTSHAIPARTTSEAVPAPAAVFSRAAARLRGLSAGDAVFYGLVVVFVHLSLMLLNQMLVFRRISPGIGPELGVGVTYGFVGNAVVNVLLEAVVFTTGWLFLSAMVVLLDGKESARALFGWLGLCYLPVVAYSLVAFAAVWFLPSASAQIAAATTGEELVAAVQAYLRGPAFVALGWARGAAYAATVLLAGAAVRRVCALSPVRSAIAVGAYLGFLLLVRAVTT